VNLYPSAIKDDLCLLLSQKLLYIRFGKVKGAIEDGGDIYDRKTLAALRRRGFEVDTIEIERRRQFAFPTWATFIPQSVHARVAAARQQGYRIICSHEALFGAVCGIPIDLLIVHNYFPAFSFARHKLIEIYYRTGARQYLSPFFRSARHILFLSERDRRHAVLQHSGIADKSFVLFPPPSEIALHKRRMDILHVSGTENWLPKRLCRLSITELSEIRMNGFQLCDFGTATNPAFGLITDRFVVGFKLKLMQMIYSRDIIASRCDVSEDMHSIAPDYPFFAQVGSVAEALEYFRSVTLSYSPEEIDGKYESIFEKQNILSWDLMAARLVEVIYS